MLLVEFLEEAAGYLHKKTERRRKLEDQYRRIYDRDLKREISIVNDEIKKKKSQITNQILLNLEEFRYLAKYFPELLSAFMEDEYIGRIITKKAWLLRYQPLPPKAAAIQLQQLRMMRKQLKEAKRFLRTWVGTVDARAFGATFPILKGHLKGTMAKDEVAEAIKKVDHILMNH